ncbi:MAG TPA: hypothetical protein PLF40_15370 [Kofleriaceae bacterium]|nr:hypothetical protein [Kofleriaceae bacterium]
MEQERAMTANEAEELLAGQALITATAGAIHEMKALRERCLAAGIPATIGCPGGGGSCGPKTHLLVSENDIPRLAQLFSNEWYARLDAEGLPPVVMKPPLPEHADEPPCPACGTAAPLVQGACSDCGLVLE